MLGLMNSNIKAQLVQGQVYKLPSPNLITQPTIYICPHFLQLWRTKMAKFSASFYLLMVLVFISGLFKLASSRHAKLF